MTRAFTEIAFTPSVLNEQEARGSAAMYEGFRAPEADRADRIGPMEADFIQRRDGFYQATVAESGWPYVQFRGGPRGFLRVLDEKTIAYADFRGNRQYLSTGNLKSDERVSLILMDYPNQRRLKIWGRAVLSDKPDHIEALMPPGYRAKPERAVIIEVDALDWNCPSHIPQRLTVEEYEPVLGELRARIKQLEAELASARS